MRRRSDDELLSAYVDGVSELTLDERRRVDDLLARDPAFRADETATRELLGKLRDLPPAGNAPDWTALERSIGEAVGPDVPRAPWWRRATIWRWVVPGVALASAATIVLIVTRDPTPSQPPPQPIVKQDMPALPTAEPIDDEAPLPLWLDGSELALDVEDDGELLDDFSAVLDIADAELEVEPDGLLSADVEWIDQLDGDSLDAAVEWLDTPGRGRKRG